MAKLRENLDKIFNLYGFSREEDPIVKLLVKNDFVMDTLLVLYDKTFQEMGGSSWGLEAKEDKEIGQEFLEVNILIKSLFKDDLVKWWIKESEKTQGCLEMSFFTDRVGNLVEFLPEKQFDNIFSYPVDRSYVRGRTAVLSYLRRSPYLIDPILKIEQEASTFFEGYLTSRLQLRLDPECGNGADFWMEIVKKVEFIPTGDAFEAYWKQREDYLDRFYDKINYYDPDLSIIRRYLAIDIKEVTQDNLDAMKK
jgi:hypothetical protein